MNGAATRVLGDSAYCGGPAEARRLFLEQLEAIEEIVRAVCRRWRFTGEQAEDFDSLVKLHLIQRDYQVLRSFRGQSRLTTYLTRVITNLARDHRARRHGRFRASRIAKRLGVEAVELERFIYREGRGHEEAIELVLRRRPRTSRRQLESLIARLPVRFPRRTIRHDDLDWPWIDETPEDHLRDRDRAKLQDGLRCCLAEAERQLSPLDRSILELRFVEGCTVAEVGRRLHLEQRPLYSRCARIFASMRHCLEEHGYSRREVSKIIGWDAPLPDQTSELDQAQPTRTLSRASESPSR